jgi:hypothetical protein
MGFVEMMDVQDRPTVPLRVRRRVRRKAHRRKKRLVISVVFLVLLLIGTGSTSFVVGLQAYHIYKADLPLAQEEMQHLRSAVTLLESLQTQPFAPQTVARARQEFTEALSNGQTIETSLANYSGVASYIPVYNTRLIAAIHLSRFSVDIAQTGIGVCTMLATILTRLNSPLSISARGLTKTDFSKISAEYQTLKTSLDAAIAEALLLQPGDLSFDTHLEMLVQEFQANIPMIRAFVEGVGRVLPALPTLLGVGTPANFLLEIMDSTELRPGGGFIGNYGIATIVAGRLKSAHISDTYLLDKPFELAGNRIPYPPAYRWFSTYLAQSGWSLRDSNLDADFPTDARNAESNYTREGGSVPVQGVIAITPFFIEHVLSITGPIGMPEYGKTVTAENLISLIHFYQLGVGGSNLLPSPNGLTSQRKYFTALLGERLLARVTHLPSKTGAKLLGLAINSLRTKDIQVYFNDSGVENLLHLLHLDGAIQSPAGDHLFIVDANVAGDKANSFIVNTVHDQVAIDEHGDAIHHTTITYVWTLPGNDYGNPQYRDYVRIYVPAGSTLSRQSGWQPRGTSTAFGSQVWAGFFTLTRGQIATITLLWTSHDVAKSGADGWRYQYLVQRQAGIQRTLSLQIMLPSCTTVTRDEGGLVSHDKQVAALTQILNEDLDVSVIYACK